MFENVGEKIKVYAKWQFWLGTIGSILDGIIHILKDAEKNAIIGILIMILGSSAAYVLSLFVYGFGELIERSCGIDAKLENSCKTTKISKKDGYELGDDMLDNIRKSFAQDGVDINMEISKPDWEKEIEELPTEKVLNGCKSRHMRVDYRVLCYRELIRRTEK